MGSRGLLRIGTVETSTHQPGGGFRRFDVAQGAEETTHYQVQVLWETAAELQSFTTSDRFEHTWAPIHPYLTRPLLIDVLLERPSLDFQGPGVLGEPRTS